MRLTDISREHAASAERQRQELLRKFALVRLGSSKDSPFLVLKEGSESKILKSLLKIGCANIYRLSRVSKDAGQYSTILRALRRLERKRLVRVNDTINRQRKQKIYSLTLLGELIASLAKGGWKLAAEQLATHSSRFREAVIAHHSFDPYYYWPQTRDIIEILRRLPKYKNVEPNIEELVITHERGWIEDRIEQNLYDPQERTKVFLEVRKLSHVDWIRPIVISFIEDIVGEEKEWVNKLVDFKEALVSDQKNAKLSQFPFNMNE